MVRAVKRKVKKSRKNAEPTLDRSAEHEESGAKLARAITCLNWIPRAAAQPQVRNPFLLSFPSYQEEEVDDQEYDQGENVEDDGNRSQDSDDGKIYSDDYSYVAGVFNERKSDYTLYVGVYDDARDNVFLRQDLPLSHPPLDVCWLNNLNGTNASFAAVSTMLPYVEIFNLWKPKDVRPASILGGPKNPENLYVPLGEDELIPGSHKDTVIKIDWNRNQPNILATSSADTTIKLWDLNTSNCAHTIAEYSVPVVGLQWHRSDRFLLVSCGLGESRARVMRVDQKDSGLAFSTAGPLECVAWHPHQEHIFAVGMSAGGCQLFDVRGGSGGQALVTFNPHSGYECSAICFNPHINGLLATGSNDQTVSLWDTRGAGASKIAQKNFSIGEILALDFNPNHPMLLAAAGTGAHELMWTITQDIAGCNFVVNR
eukprot:NODE_1238_length_1623_cov_25.611817_g1103_i0.p1 GENE.NODE_1238_length_1623_cov_25.611817_g1103_i0~~NODE_1238_length_1623_cov_25.611817_g1103_i0.p1  ORF type:complete len:428 (-),score=73.14 NODE_1238_length_1623_cov_25.611817_g1103_i0:188-1471(-)